MTDSVTMKRFFAAFAVYLGLIPFCAAQEGRLSSEEAAKWADAMDQALIDNFWGASFPERPIWERATTGRKRTLLT